MEKSIYSQEYKLFLELLRETRETKGLSQTQVAERIGQTQSFVSKVERGERRLDIIELRAFCSALDIPLSRFVVRIERELGNISKLSRPS